MESLLYRGMIWVLAVAVAGLYYLELRGDRVAYVNTAVLLNEYEGMIAARKAYAGKVKSWQAKIDTLAAEVEEAIREYERESAGMSAGERERGRRLIREKQERLAAYQRTVREKSRQEDNLATQEVVADINNFLQEYGRRRGYRIILATTEAGNIAYADESLDITREVVEELNNRYRGMP